LGAAALAVALVLGACSDGDGDGRRDQSRATVPTAPSTTSAVTSTTAGDDFAVPATIDVAYVQRVIDELDRLDGEATRLIVESKELVLPAATYISAVYAPDELNVQLGLWADEVNDGLERYRRPPGAVVTTVERLVRSEQSCVIAEVRRDFSRVATDTEAPRVSFMTLEPRRDNQDRGRLNRTPWMITAAPLDQREAEAACS
jgi:hypothetical protein